MRISELLLVAYGVWFLVAVPGSSARATAPIVLIDFLPFGASGQTPDEDSSRVKELLSRLAEAKDPEAKVKLLQSLRLSGPAAAKDSPSLDRFLDDPDKRVRLQSALTISYLSPKRKTPIVRLMAFLDDADPWYVVSAASGLEIIGEDAEAAIPALIKAVKRNNPETMHLPVALARVGPRNKAAKEALVELTERGQTPGFRGVGARALGIMGEYSVDAIPVLDRLLQLQGDTESVGQDLWSQIRGARQNAAEALGKVGKHAPMKVVPSLIKVLRDKNSSNGVRRSAMNAVKAIGGSPKEAIPALVLCLEEKDLVSISASTLAQFGVVAVKPMLEFAMDKNQQTFNRSITFQHVSIIAQSHEQVYESIIACGKSGDELISRLAVQALRNRDQKKKVGK